MFEILSILSFIYLLYRIVYKYRSSNNQKERKRLTKAFLFGCLPILIWGFIFFMIFT